MYTLLAPCAPVCTSFTSNSKHDQTHRKFQMLIWCAHTATTAETIPFFCMGPVWLCASVCYAWYLYVFQIHFMKPIAVMCYFHLYFFFFVSFILCHRFTYSHLFFYSHAFVVVVKNEQKKHTHTFAYDLTYSKYKRKTNNVYFWVLLSSSASPFPTHSLWLWMINRNSYRNRNIQYLCWHDANERPHEIVWTKSEFLVWQHILTRQIFYHCHGIYNNMKQLNHSYSSPKILSRIERMNLIFNQASLNKTFQHNCFEVFRVSSFCKQQPFSHTIPSFSM